MSRASRSASSTRAKCPPLGIEVHRRTLYIRPLAGRHSLVDELAGEDGDPGRSRTERWRSRSTFPDPRLGNLSPSREVIHDQDQLEAALAHDPDVSRWNGKSLSSGQLAKIYGFTDLDGSQPDAWRYVTEVQDAGKPADVTGYR